MRYGVLVVLVVPLLACGTTSHYTPQHIGSALPSDATRTVQFFNGVELTLPPGMCLTIRKQGYFDLLEFKSESTVLAGAYAGTAGNFPSEGCSKGRSTRMTLPSNDRDSVVLVREEIAGPACHEIAFRAMEPDGRSSSGVLFHLWQQVTPDVPDQRIEDLLHSIRIGAHSADDIISNNAICQPAA